MAKPSFAGNSMEKKTVISAFWQKPANPGQSDQVFLQFLACLLD